MSIEKPNPELWRGDSLPWIEKVVVEALAKARAREASLPEPGPPPDGLVRQLDAMTRRLHDFTAFADAPRPVLAQIDEEFRNGEEEMRQFLTAVESIRHKLAACTERIR